MKYESAEFCAAHWRAARNVKRAKTEHEMLGGVLRAGLQEMISNHEQSLE